MTGKGLIARTPARIALVAHDGRKQALLTWVKEQQELLSRHYLYGTGTTGELITRETGLIVSCFKSGPLGGDQQIGAKIVDNEIDMLVFFWDPLNVAPHDADVKALLRIAVLCDIPTACNHATADFLAIGLRSGSDAGLPSPLHRQNRDAADRVLEVSP